MKNAISRRRLVQMAAAGPVLQMSGFTSPVSLQARSGRGIFTDDEGGLLCEYPVHWAAVRLVTTEGIAFELSCVPSGSGRIGEVRTWGNFDNLRSTPIRNVQFKSFMIGTFEVTQEQWLFATRLPRVREDLPVTFRLPLGEANAQYPVEHGVRFRYAVELCDRLSRYFQVPFRLPSESEWEYAARAGSATRFYFGERANRSVGERLSTGRFASVRSGGFPNRFGLHNLAGGMGEWCEDFENADYRNAPLDGSAWITSGNRNSRIVRGEGGYTLGGSSYRSSFIDGGFYSTLGLRIAATLDHGVTDCSVRWITLGNYSVPQTIAPYSILSVFGQFGYWLTDAHLPLVEVFVGFVKTKVLYASATQINCVVPAVSGLEPGDAVAVTVKAGFQSSLPFVMKWVQTLPALLPSENAAYVVAMDSTGTVFHTDRPAAAGQVVCCLATGLGELIDSVDLDSLATARIAAKRTPVIS